MIIKDLIKKYENTLEELIKHYGYDYSKASVYEAIINDLKQCQSKLENTKILLVEDGSVDLEKEQEPLEALGYKVIVYKQGSNKPEVINK